MTKYHKFAPAALAVVLVLAMAVQAKAGPLDEAFSPRPVPGLTLASLDVPVASVVQAKPAAPVREFVAPAPGKAAAPEPEKGFWDRTREFFGF